LDDAKAILHDVQKQLIRQQLNEPEDEVCRQRLRETQEREAGFACASDYGNGIWRADGGPPFHIISDGTVF